MASKYGHGCPDKSANGLFKLCKKTGPISKIPKTPGLVVWRSGHIGISLDGEYAIEARGFNYGVVRTRIRNRNWEKWGMKLVKTSGAKGSAGGRYQCESIIDTRGRK